MSFKTRLYFIFTYYFQFWASLVLKRWNPIIIAVVGSAGKTTTMNMIQHALEHAAPLKVSYKTNAASAIPLNILGLSQHTFTPGEWVSLVCKAPFRSFVTPKEKVYLCELDTDRSGEMALHTRLIKPDICCWMSATPAHTASFSGQNSESIYQNMLEDQKQAAVHTRSLILYNADDPNIAKLSRTFSTKQYGISFESKDPSAVISVKKYELNFNGTHVQFALNSSMLGRLLEKPFPDDHIDIHIPYALVSELNLYGLSMALLLAYSFGLHTDQISGTLKTFRLPPGRMSLFAGKHATTIIDSSYNASKLATMDALDVLSGIGSGGTLAILGDMRELGVFSKTEHEELAKYIADKRIDRVILVGPCMREYAAPILTKHSYQPGNSLFLASPKEAKELVNSKGFLQPGETVLVKASQNTLFLEEIVRSLLASAKDTQFLCRQEEIWNKPRSRVYEV